MKTKLLLSVLLASLLGGCVAVPVSHVPPPPRQQVIVVREYYPTFTPMYVHWYSGFWIGGHRHGPYRR